ncbi:MAG: hypothetical protein AAB801_01565 [Patescibacteria group bacterium]
MKKPKIILSALILMTITLVIARSVVSNAISPNGTFLSETLTEKSALMKENKILRERLFAKTSLSAISKEAERLGFVEKRDSFKLTEPLPIAKR